MIWTTGRNQQLGELIAEVFRSAGAVPREYRAVIAGGPPGADKAAALERLGADRSQFLVISVGGVLTRMAACGLIPGVAGRPPLAGAGLVHAEAQQVAKRIGLVAINDGWNVLLDVTLASLPSAESWTYALRFADYSVTAVYAGLTPGESVRRSEAAYRHDEDEYQQGRGFGGRPLPPDAIEALAGPAAAAARDSIRWASGAEPASVTAGRTRRGGRPSMTWSRTCQALSMTFRWPTISASSPMTSTSSWLRRSASQSPNRADVRGPSRTPMIDRWTRARAGHLLGELSCA